MNGAFRATNCTLGEWIPVSFSSLANAASLTVSISTLPALTLPTIFSGFFFPAFLRFFAIGESSSRGWVSVCGAGQGVHPARGVSMGRYGKGHGMSSTIGRIRARGDDRDLQRLHLGLGPLEPELHTDLVEHAHRGGQMLPGRGPIACSRVQLAEAEAAARDERAHAELRGQGRGGGKVGPGRPRVRVVLMCSGLAQEVVGPGLVTALATLAGEHHGTGAPGARLLHMAREEVRLAEPHRAHRVQISDPGTGVSVQGLLQP